MAKTRSFTIFLLKKGFSDQNSLKEDHKLERTEDVTNLPEGGTMYLSDIPAKAPWWKSYWGVQKDLKQTLKGALIFLPIKNRWVVLTFGMTYHKLKDESYEYDFGLKTTLNSLNPEKIKSTDILVPENAKRQRIQSPTVDELTFFDLTNDDSILKKMTGAVKKEYAELFKNITGGNSVRISLKRNPTEIIGICEQLIDIYNKDDYKNSFPGLQNIVPISDPIILEQLNNTLIKAFNQEDAPFELILAIPEIFDYSLDYKIEYLGAGGSNKSYSEVYIYDYRTYLEEKDIEIANYDTLKSHRLVVKDDNDKTIKEYSIFKSLLFDCELDKKTYHLCEGKWYLINTEFVEELSRKLDPIFRDEKHIYLHDCEDRKEEDYNNSVANTFENNVICLDRKNISPTGQYQVEPCDLIYTDKDYLEFAHIKVSTRSSSLSHLFNQGLNSVQLLRSNSEARDKLKNLIHMEEMHLNIDNMKFSVIYGIITNNDRSKRSKSLPFFSRISLLRTFNVLRMMNIPVEVYFIKDNVNRKNI